MNKRNEVLREIDTLFESVSLDDTRHLLRKLNYNDLTSLRDAVRKIPKKVYPTVAGKTVITVKSTWLITQVGKNSKKFGMVRQLNEKKRQNYC